MFLYLRNGDLVDSLQSIDVTKLEQWCLFTLDVSFLHRVCYPVLYGVEQGIKCIISQAYLKLFFGQGNLTIMDVCLFISFLCLAILVSIRFIRHTFCMFHHFTNMEQSDPRWFIVMLVDWNYSKLFICLFLLISYIDCQWCTFVCQRCEVSHNEFLEHMYIIYVLGCPWKLVTS